MMGKRFVYEHFNQTYIIVFILEEQMAIHCHLFFFFTFESPSFLYDREEKGCVIDGY